MTSRWLEWLKTTGVVMAACGLAGLAAATAVAIQTRLAAEAVSAQDPAQALVVLGRALRARPDLADSWYDQADWLQDRNAAAARESASRSVRLDSRDWRSWILLGELDFEAGRIRETERDFTQAVRYSNGFAAHFELANFAFLLGNRTQAWGQMRAALAVATPGDAVYAVNQMMAWANGPHDPELLASVPNAPAGVLARVADGLLDGGDYRDAAALIGRMACSPTDPGLCRAAEYYFSNHALAVAFGQPPAQQAAEVGLVQSSWREAVQRGWMLPADAEGKNLCGDGNFIASWHGAAYSWETPGPISVVRSGTGLMDAAGSAEIEFDGQEPENIDLLRQFVPVEAGATYRVSFQFHAPAGVPGGISLGIMAPGQRLLTNIPATSSGNWTTSSGLVVVPADVHLLYLIFQYRRPVGQLRVQTPEELADVQMVKVP